MLAVAERLGCAETTVLYQLQKAGIERRQIGSPAGPDHPNRRSVTVKCAACGKQTVQQRSKAARANRHFCDRACRTRWQQENMPKGRAYPSHNSEVEVPCAWCGRALMLKPHQVKERNFCPRLERDCCHRHHSAHSKGPNASGWKGGPVNALCAWCGRLVIVQRGRYTRRRGGGLYFCRARPDEKRSKCDRAWNAFSKRGVRSLNWNGGITQEHALWSAQAKGRRWRRLCRKRDGYTCQLCGRRFHKHDRGLHVHHKAPWAEHPALRSVVENGVSLCERCHIGRVETNEGAALRERWEGEAVAELGHLTAQPAPA